MYEQFSGQIKGTLIKFSNLNNSEIISYLPWRVTCKIYQNICNFPTLYITVPFPQGIVMDVCKKLATCMLISAKDLEKSKYQSIEDQ